MTRDEIIKLASQAIDDTRSAVSLPIPFVMRFAALVAAAERAERTEREKQEPIAWYCDGEDGREYNGCPQMSNGRTGTPLYAAPPVTAPVRLTDSEAEAVARIHGTGGWQTLADMMKFSRAVETAVLRANGFDIQPAKGE